MKYKLILFTLITILTIFLVGCYPTGAKALPSTSDVQAAHPSDISNSGGDSELTQPFVGTVSKKIGDVEFNYEISADYPTRVAKIKLKPKQFDDELVKNLLLRNKTIVSESEGRWYTSDESVLISGYGSLIFLDNGAVDERKNIRTLAGVYNDFCRSSSEQLKTFSSQDAVERVNNLLDKIGVENYGEPYIIPVSPEEGNAYFEEHGGFGNSDGEKRFIPLEESDGVYVLKYQFKFNGINLSSGNIKTLGTARTIQGAEISAYVTKDSVFYLEINSLYDVVSLNEGEVAINFDAGYASNAIIDHYSKLAAIDNPRFFTECTLEYVPVEFTDENEIVFMPAWCFMGYELKLGDTPWDIADYYYAETGIRYGSF